MSVSKENFLKKDNNIDIIEEKKEDFDNLFKDKNIVNVEEKVVEDNYSLVKTEETKSFPKKKKILFLIILLVMISLLIIFLSVILGYNITHRKIFSNMYISGIDVSNLTKEDAISKIENELLSVLNQEILIECEGKEYKIKPSDIGVKYNVQELVNEVYKIGRSGNILQNNINMIKTFFVDTNLELSFTHEDKKFEEIISEINSQFSSLVQSSYKISDDKVVIKKGSRGIEVKSDELKEKIINSINELNFEPIEVGVIAKSPDAIDIEAIHDEVYKAPVDAYYTKNPFEIHKSEEGVDFAISIEEAKKLLEENKEEYVIKLKTLKPKITTDQIGTEAFPDLLSTCTTSYITSKVGRTTNLKLASKKINGYVLMPGETFSYNKVVGERTAEAGFQLAGVYSGGQEVQGLGGGICQISSTLYNIVIKSNLEIVERENHSFLPGYLPAGQDATVVYGAIDFKFKNTRDYPVKIVSSVGGGYVTMKMYGVKEKNEPEISFQTVYHETLYPKTTYKDTADLAEGKTKVESSGKNGCKSTTYKVVKQNGKVVSKTVLSKDTYQAMNKVVLRGTKKVAEPTVDKKEESKKEESKVENNNEEQTPSTGSNEGTPNGTGESTTEGTQPSNGETASGEQQPEAIEPAA